MAYKNIKSTFAKKELQKTKWKDREYIDQLHRIELFAQGKYCSTGAGYILNILKDKYPQQWKAIWRELNPTQYRKNVELEKKEREQVKFEQEKMKREKALELKRDKAEWRKGGGKI